MSNNYINAGIVLLIPIAFLIGNYWSSGIDYKEEQVNLISCGDYSDDFLEYMGYSGADKKENCEDLHMALREQALGDCEDRIGLISEIGEKRYQQVMDSCVYHELAGSIGVINTVGMIKYRQQ